MPLLVPPRECHIAAQASSQLELLRLYAGKLSAPVRVRSVRHPQAELDTRSPRCAKSAAEARAAAHLRAHCRRGEKSEPRQKVCLVGTVRLDLFHPRPKSLPYTTAHREYHEWSEVAVSDARAAPAAVFPTVAEGARRAYYPYNVARSTKPSKVGRPRKSEREILIPAAFKPAPPFSKLKVTINHDGVTQTAAIYSSNMPRAVVHHAIMARSTSNAS